MAIAKKDRFEIANLKIKVGSYDNFPPEKFFYNDEEYQVLGLSNHKHLMPINVSTTELQKIVTIGGLEQFVCSNDSGDLFEACFYRDNGDCFLFAFGTRERPDCKQKKVSY